MRKQTPQEREFIKKELRKKLPTAVMNVVETIQDDTSFLEIASGKSFNCIEVQLKGCLIENGLRRRYVSYGELENYKVGN
jgi:hypothetical protein